MDFPTYRPYQAQMPGWLTDILNAPTPQQRVREAAKEQATMEYQQGLTQQLQESMEAKRRENLAAELLSKQLRAWYDTPEDARKENLTNAYVRAAMESGEPDYVQAAAKMVADMEQTKATADIDKFKMNLGLAKDIGKATGDYSLLGSVLGTPGKVGEWGAGWKYSKRDKSGETDTQRKKRQLDLEAAERKAQNADLNDQIKAQGDRVKMLQNSIKAYSANPLEASREGSPTALKLQNLGLQLEKEQAKYDSLLEQKITGGNKVVYGKKKGR